MKDERTYKIIGAAIEVQSADYLSACGYAQAGADGKI